MSQLTDNSTLYDLLNRSNAFSNALKGALKYIIVMPLPSQFHNLDGIPDGRFYLNGNSNLDYQNFPTSIGISNLTPYDVVIEQQTYSSNNAIQKITAYSTGAVVVRSHGKDGWTNWSKISSDSNGISTEKDIQQLPSKDLNHMPDGHFYLSGTDYQHLPDNVGVSDFNPYDLIVDQSTYNNGNKLQKITAYSVGAVYVRSFGNGLWNNWSKIN